MSEPIEVAQCRLGYPDEQLDRILGDRRDDFDYWMRGQTMAICDGTTYDHELRASQPSGCGPHGVVAYSWDVKRFLAGLPVVD